MEESQYVLHIYRAESGQYSGKIYEENEEIGGVAGCESEEEVYKSIQEMYETPIDFVVDGYSGKILSHLSPFQKPKKG